MITHVKITLLEFSSYRGVSIPSNADANTWFLHFLMSFIMNSLQIRVKKVITINPINRTTTKVTSKLNSSKFLWLGSRLNSSFIKSMRKAKAMDNKTITREF